jgi:alpha/beta superfamily hydrolase
MCGPSDIHSTATWPNRAETLAGQLLAGGARCAVLLSRTARLAAPDLAALAASGAPVFVARADAGDAAVMARVLAWARERLPAVGTYAHAAGVLAQVRDPL